MAWIESHQSLREHPKLLKLMFILDIKKNEAIGILHMLWWWCIDYAPTGDISKFDDFQIAKAVEWDKDPSLFVKAMSSSGFIENIGNSMIIHDWHDFCGALMERRLLRMEHKRPRLAAVRPPTNLTNHTNQHISNDDAFNAFWEEYGYKKGKKPTQKAWDKISPPPMLIGKIMAAVRQYKQTDGYKRGYIKEPATWLNQERWNDEIKVTVPETGSCSKCHLNHQGECPQL